MSNCSAVLGDYVSLQRGTTYKSGLLGMPGPKLLGLASIGRDGGFRADNLKTYGGDSPEALLLRPGDLFVSLKDVTQAGDLLGAIARVPDSISLGRLTQDTVKLKLKQGSPASSYLYWLLRTPEYRSYCRGHGTGTTNLGLAREDFLSFPVPPLNRLRELVYKSLDYIEAKIEQNTRTARAVESLARAIFQAWFFDFEPVKAKAEGATFFPSMPQPVFDALPTCFEDSKIGLVPEAWCATPITELLDVNPSRSLRKNETAPHLDMKNMPTDGHHPDQLGVRPFGSGAKFINGDTLVARITPCLENGKTAFVNFLDEGQVAWGSTEYIVLRPRAPIPAIFAYMLARSDEFRQFAIQSMTGTSGRQRVPFSALPHYLIARPPADMLGAFGALVDPMIELSTAAHVESKKLAEIRDLLLPRLLSGELRVATECAE